MLKYIERVFVAIAGGIGAVVMTIFGAIVALLIFILAIISSFIVPISVGVLFLALAFKLIGVI